MLDLTANERLVVDAFRTRPVISRAELVRQIGLPKATVNGVVARLLRRGLIREEPAGDQAGRRGQGRPAAALMLAGPVGTVGVIAFSHLAARTAVVTVDGRVLSRRECDLSDTDDEDDVLDHGARLLDAALAEVAGAGAEAGMGSVVVGVPAPFEPGVGVTEAAPSAEVRAGMAGAKSTFHRLHRDPAPDLSARFGVPTTADNDANLGALGEAVFGAGRGIDSFVYLKVVEGLGAGLYLDGRLYRGVRGLAGELAHVQVADDGSWCRCGGRGCLGRAFGGFLSPYVEAAYGRPMRFADVVSFIRHGEAGTHRIVADAGRRVGRVVADLCTMLGPEAVIVDAALGAAAVPFVAGLREMVDRHSPAATAAAVRIVPGKLDDRAELLGAAALARQQHLGR